MFVGGQKHGGAIEFGFTRTDARSDTIGDLRARVRQRFHLPGVEITIDTGGPALGDDVALEPESDYNVRTPAPQPPAPPPPGPPSGGGQGDIWTGPTTVIPEGGMFELEL